MTGSLTKGEMWTQVLTERLPREGEHRNGDDASTPEKCRRCQWTIRSRAEEPLQMVPHSWPLHIRFQLPDLQNNALLLSEPFSLGDTVTAAPGNDYLWCIYFNFIRNYQTGYQSDCTIQFPLPMCECPGGFSSSQARGIVSLLTFTPSSHGHGISYCF